MLGAAVYHIPHMEWPNVLLTPVYAGVMAILAYGRARLAPLQDRQVACQTP
jgi:hypothetical protein